MVIVPDLVKGELRIIQLAELARALRRARPHVRRPGAELPPIPAGEPARSREAEQRRHLDERTVAVPHVTFGELPPHGVDDRGKRLSLACETTVHGPPVHAQVLRDAVDRAGAAPEQHHDQLPGPASTCCPRRPGRLCFEQLLCVLRHRGIGVGVRQVEVRARTHDAVEVVSELHVPAEHAVVHRAVGGRARARSTPALAATPGRAARSASGTRRRPRAPSTVVRVRRGPRSAPRAARRRPRPPRSQAAVNR